MKNEKKGASGGRDLLRRAWVVLSRNIGLKLLSILFALLLWSYVVTTNPSITRNKTVTGLNAYINGQTTLSASRLALASDPGDALNGLTVVLEVPQSEYAFVSQENVQVLLDLTTVRSSGTQSVPFRATTSYGKVLRVIPESLTLSFEALDSRSVPVNANLVGTEQDRLWYNKSRINPTQLTISGAASVVQSIASASVAVDVEGREEGYTAALPYTLLDSEGSEIPQNMLNCSASSITVGIEIYPTRELPISDSVDTVLTGLPAKGYVVESIQIQPDTVLVAAEQDLLDTLDELLVQPISVDGVSQSFSRRVALSTLADIRYTSAEQVYVSVTIVEETITSRVGNVNLVFTGKSDDLLLSWTREDFSVRVTGPRSRVEALEAEGLVVTVDLSGLGAGSYQLPMTISEEDYPDISFELDPALVTVVLEEEKGQE